MAEALLKNKLENHGIREIQVSSCGLDANPWSTAEPRLQLVIGDAYKMLKNFRSRPISLDIVGEADVILAMEDALVHDILSRFPGADGKTFTVTDYVGVEGEIVDFPDSHSDFMEWLKSCYATLDRCLDRLVVRMSRSRAVEDDRGKAS